MRARNQVVLQSIIMGLGGIVILSFFYFILLTWISGDWRHPLAQFLLIKYWMSALFVGFGLQAGLFWYVRSATKAKYAQKVAAANAGVSTATMIACCAHHLIDFVPILGVSALAVFAAKYQAYFLAIGIVFNIFGIIYMFLIIKKHKLYQITSAIYDNQG